MRFFVPFLAIAALGCGPQIAFIEGEDFDVPSGVGQPVQPAERPVEIDEAPGRAPRMSAFGLVVDSFGVLAEAPDDGGEFAGGDDAGVIDSTDAGVIDSADAGVIDSADAGGSEPVDAGESEPSNAGGSEPVDAGGSDAGMSAPMDAGMSAPSDAGMSAPSDAGMSAPSDAGMSAPSDAGGSAPVDTGGSEPVDAGVSAPIDAGVGEPSDAGAPLPSWDGGTNGLGISVHLALGVPDDSRVGAADRWLLVRSQLVTSYDTTRKVPRWTSWKLDSTDFGPATRATSFRMDPLLPSGVSQARDSDYVGSGFDRGHLCPSADRTSTDADNDATFFLTNVVPQTHTSNAGPWLDLEDEARTIAGTGKKLVIIAGPVFGVTRQAIGTGVEVPLSMFKVAIVLDGPYSPASATSSTKVYAAIVPNASVLSGTWRTYQVTVDEVERQTGLDFLSDLPPALQQQLEEQVSP